MSVSRASMLRIHHFAEEQTGELGCLILHLQNKLFSILFNSKTPISKWMFSFGYPELNQKLVPAILLMYLGVLVEQ